MKLVKICKRPYIAEDEDRWGQGLGTYSVMGSEVGMVEEPFWNELDLFENYGNTPEGKAEQEAGKKHLNDGGSMETLEAPIMKKLLDRSKTQLWQFNMQLTEKPDENGAMSYLRSYAIFNEPSLRVHTEEHDKEVNKLQNKCKEMNSEKDNRDQ